VASAHIIATYWGDPLIYSYIPGANSYFVGLSIVMGITAFGVMGALLGPLIIGTLVTLKDIYISYIQSLPMEDRGHNNSPRNILQQKHSSHPSSSPQAEGTGNGGGITSLSTSQTVSSSKINLGM
jgi:hypothetical protein